MNNTNNSEILEVKKLLTQMATMLQMIIPNKVSVSYLAETTNKSRQAIRQYLINNYEPEVQFWNEGGKTFVAKEVALAILQRHTKQKAYA